MNLNKEIFNFSHENVPEQVVALSNRLTNPLPGLVAQIKAAPPYRPTSFEMSELESARKAAVLWLMYPNQEGMIEGVLIERAEYDGVHSKQVGMPGGEMELSDTDYIDTALRECREELGIAVHRENVLGALSPLYIPPSNFYVRPYVAWLHTRPVWSPDEREVSNVLGCKMSYISEPETWKSYEVNGMQVPGFLLESRLVWGATAMMIAELMECWKLPDTFAE